jgi:hypothetical protein
VSYGPDVSEGLLKGKALVVSARGLLVRRPRSGMGFSRTVRSEDFRIRRCDRPGIYLRQSEPLVDEEEIRLKTLEEARLALRGIAKSWGNARI